MMTTGKARSFGGRLAARWERLSGPRQLLVVYPLCFCVLLAIHMAFFHRITTGRSVAYSLGEALFITAFVMLATASEHARKARLAQQRDGHTAHPANDSIEM